MNFTGTIEIITGSDIDPATNQVNGKSFVTVQVVPGSRETQKQAVEDVLSGKGSDLKILRHRVADFVFVEDNLKKALSGLVPALSSYMKYHK